MDFQSSIKSTCSKLFSLAMKGVAKREVGSLEAVDALLNLWLTKTDSLTTIKWVNTDPDKKKRLKSKAYLDCNPESTDIFCLDDVNSRYPERPDSMEDTCLFDFIHPSEVPSVTMSPLFCLWFSRA